MSGSNLSPRYPPIGAWPAVMRADMAAAYLDYQSVRELVRAVSRGEAPSPTAFRGTGHRRQPVWTKAALDGYADRSRSPASAESDRDLAALV
jgi:hypothetical protein